MNVDDVEAEYERLKAKGVAGEEPPQDRPWGKRQFVFRDPNGLAVNIAKSSSASAGGAPSPQSRWPRSWVGYPLRPGFDLPPLMFSADELQALRLGAEIVQGRADTDTARAALERIEALLPEKLQRTGPQPFCVPDFFIPAGAK